MNLITKLLINLKCLMGIMLVLLCLSLPPLAVSAPPDVSPAGKPINVGDSLQSITAEADRQIGDCKLGFVKLLGTTVQSPAATACSNLWVDVRTRTNQLAQLAASLSLVEARIAQYQTNVRNSRLDSGPVQDLVDEADNEKAKIAQRRAEALAFRDFLVAFLDRLETQVNEVIRLVGPLYGESTAMNRVRDLLTQEYDAAKAALTTMGGIPKEAPLRLSPIKKPIASSKAP